MAPRPFLGLEDDGSGIPLSSAVERAVVRSAAAYQEL